MAIDDFHVIEALARLEHLSKDYIVELKYLSKRIRMDIWDPATNSKELACWLNTINADVSSSYNVEIDESFTLDAVIYYVDSRAKSSVYYCYKPYKYFAELADNIRLVNAEKQITQQWRDVHASEDGYKCFMEIFDDVFTQAIDIHKEKFFH